MSVVVKSAPGWIVWFDRRGTSIWRCDDREEAFRVAYMLEEDYDEWPSDIIGIEDPTGQFIDVAEYRAEKPRLEDRVLRREAERKAADKSATKYRITISGPDGHSYAETWTTEYLDKYRDKYLAVFGPGRVIVEKVT